MASLQFSIIVAVTLIAMSTAAPAPEPSFWKPAHKHVIIHVPYKVHTYHHHHVEKVPIYKEVPVIKHVPIYKEVPVHYPVIKEVPVPVHYESHSHGWDAESSHGWY